MNDARKSFENRPAPAAGRSFASGEGDLSLGEILARSLGDWTERVRLKRDAEARMIAKRGGGDVQAQKDDEWREFETIPANDADEWASSRKRRNAMWWEA